MMKNSQQNISAPLSFGEGKGVRLQGVRLLERLTKLCSTAEHSTKEMTDKMTRWGVPDDVQQQVIGYLHEEKYVDDARFCRAFIEDKMRNNGWGRRKIEQALYIKGVDRSVSNPLFADIPEERFLDILRPLLQHKQVSAKNDYERRQKLIRFALSRGFSVEEAQTCLDELQL